MSDYMEDLGLLGRESRDLSERENALSDTHDDAQFSLAQGDPDVGAVMRARSDFATRKTALFAWYNRPGVDPNTVERPGDPDDCTWLP